VAVLDDQAAELIRKAMELVVSGVNTDSYLKVGGLPSSSVGQIPPIPVTTSAQPLGDLIFEKALDSGGSPDMNVIASLIAPVEFTIDADATERKVIEEMTFKAFDSGIKNNNFLGLNSALTNGITITIKSQNNSSSFIPIFDTVDFDAHFALGPGGRFNTIFAAGQDSVVAKFSPQNPFILEPVGTFSPDPDDSVIITINDNLSTVTFLDMTVFGFLEAV